MFYRLILKLFTNKKQGSIHSFAQTLILLISKFYRLFPIKPTLPTSPLNIMGLSFANPVGLAAGFDRNGKFLPYSELIGFGFIEIGTLNIDATKALDEKVITTLQNLNKSSKNKKKFKQPQLKGINLGSLRNTLDEYTVADYRKGMDLFWQYADYLVINLSRPESDARAFKPDIYGMESFLINIQHHHQTLTTKHGKHIPLLAKLAIDYQHNESSAELILLLKQREFDGVVLAFENWPDIEQISNYLHNIKTEHQNFSLIVVGGIHSTQDCQQVMAAGASLVQIYTALVQQGPLKIRQMIVKLVNKRQPLLPRKKL
jgi:dihydroorotate dehydrogenase